MCFIYIKKIYFQTKKKQNIRKTKTSKKLFINYIQNLYY